MYFYVEAMDRLKVDCLYRLNWNIDEMKLIKENYLFFGINVQIFIIPKLKIRI